MGPVAGLGNELEVVEFGGAADPTKGELPAVGILVGGAAAKKLLVEETVMEVSELRLLVGPKVLLDPTSVEVLVACVLMGVELVVEETTTGDLEVRELRMEEPPPRDCVVVTPPGSPALSVVEGLSGRPFVQTPVASQANARPLG